ncbi:MAG: hypothetical protein ACI81A_002864 [Paraglaciecola sp.]|jgi:hypothetical protein
MFDSVIGAFAIITNLFIIAAGFTGVAFIYSQLLKSKVSETTYKFSRALFSA